MRLKVGAWMKREAQPLVGEDVATDADRDHDQRDDRGEVAQTLADRGDHGLAPAWPTPARVDRLLRRTRRRPVAPPRPRRGRHEALADEPIPLADAEAPREQRLRVRGVALAAHDLGGGLVGDGGLQRLVARRQVARARGRQRLARDRAQVRRLLGLAGHVVADRRPVCLRRVGAQHREVRDAEARQSDGVVAERVGEGARCPARTLTN